MIILYAVKYDHNHHSVIRNACFMNIIVILYLPHLHSVNHLPLYLCVYKECWCSKVYCLVYTITALLSTISILVSHNITPVKRASEV